jgi:hypothetical protein
VGDIYLTQLFQAETSTYQAQYQGMFGCAVGSLRAVLDAAGVGLQSPTVRPIDPAVDPAACFSQRATNAAISAGYGIDYAVDGVQKRIPLEELAAGLVIVDPVIAALGGGIAVLPARLSLAVIRLGALVRLQAAADPQGTQLAEGGMGDFLGVHPNAAYDSLGSYVDPPLPWPGGATGADSNQLVLARQFHRAHAQDLCDRFGATDPEFDLDKLRARATNTHAAADDPVCQVCTVFAVRHLRIGDPATYVPSEQNEPLCGLVATDPSAVQFVFQPVVEGLAPDDLARHFCGCSRVAVSPKTVVVPPGGQQQFTATAPPGETVTWSASDGSIDGTGLFTAPTTSGGPITVRAVTSSDFDEATVTGAHVYRGSVSARINQPPTTDCSGAVCVTRHATEDDEYANLVFVEQPDGSFAASGTFSTSAQDEQATADGCDVVRTENGSGAITGYSGRLPSNAKGFLAASAVVTTTVTSAPCRGQPGGSNTSTSTVTFEVGTDGLTATFSGSTLTGLTWDFTTTDSTNTTFTVQGEVSLVP